MRNIIAPIATLIFGIVIGVAASPGGAAEPETVTVTAEPEVVTETVTETVEVEVVPQACLDALDDANALITSSAEVSQAVISHLDDDAILFGQMSRLDFENVDWYLEGQNEFVVEMERITTEVGTSTYAVNRDACRAAGE